MDLFYDLFYVHVKEVVTLERLHDSVFQKAGVDVLYLTPNATTKVAAQCSSRLLL